MIEEAYVSFEVAKLLKEKGFDIPCNCYGAYSGVNLTYRLCITDKYTNWNKHTDKRIISCPTLQMAMKWLRKVCNLCVVIYPQSDILNPPITLWYSASIYDLEKKCCINTFEELEEIKWISYEQACEAAIKYCLENLI